MKEFDPRAASALYEKDPNLLKKIAIRESMKKGAEIGRSSGKLIYKIRDKRNDMPWEKDGKQDESSGALIGSIVGYKLGKMRYKREVELLRKNGYIDKEFSDQYEYQNQTPQQQQPNTPRPLNSLERENQRKQRWRNAALIGGGILGAGALAYGATKLYKGPIKNMIKRQGILNKRKAVQKERKQQIWNRYMRMRQYLTDKAEAELEARRRG